MSSLVSRNIENFAVLQGQNRAVCYSYNCNAADESYVVSVLDKTVNCSKQGGVKSVDGLEGSFYCSDYNLVCTKSAKCKDAIECAINKVTYNIPTYDYTADNSNAINGGKGNVQTSSGNHERYLNVFAYFYVIMFVFIFGN